MKWLAGWVVWLIFLLVILYLAFLPYFAQANPPEPKTQYKFEAHQNGTIILFFQRDGYKQRFVYQQIAQPQAATGCVSRYYGKYMELITFDLSMPTWYIVDAEPFMRWDVKKQEYIRLGRNNAKKQSMTQPTIE